MAFTPASSLEPVAVTVSGAVSVSNFPATQPVSGTVAVSNLPATQPVSGTVAVSGVAGTVLVDGSAVTQPVSAASLPLPAGAATEDTLVEVKRAANDTALTAILERDTLAA